MGAENQPRPAAEIAVAVVEHQGRYLIGLRPANVALAGLWEFPGGKVEAGETTEAAAIRECLEEALLEVAVTGRYETVEHSYPHGTLQLHFVACRVVSERGSLPERFRWVTREELAQYEFPPANAQLLRRLASKQ